MNLPPTDWPDPPLLRYLVLESPWALAVVLLAVGLALVFVARRRGHAGPAYVGCVLMALAILVPIIAYLVETGRERILENTRTLVMAAQHPFEMPVFLEMTTQDVTMLELNREQMLALARRLEQAMQVQDLTITNTMAIQDSEDYGRSYFAAFGELRSTGFEAKFKVQAILRWRREADGRWRVHQIEQMALNDQPAGQLVPALR